MVIFYHYHVLYKFLYLMQLVYTLVRRHVLSLHCLPMSRVLDARQRWLNPAVFYQTAKSSKAVVLILFVLRNPLCLWLLSEFFRPTIMKTCLYNFDPLKPHFYKVKLGITGVYIIFLISAKNIDCGYSLEPPRRGGSNEYPQSMF